MLVDLDHHPVHAVGSGDQQPAWSLGQRVDTVHVIVLHFVSLHAHFTPEIQQHILVVINFYHIVEFHIGIMVTMWGSSWANFSFTKLK